MPSPPPIPAPGTFGAKVVNVLTGLNVRLYRATGGRLGGRMSGAPVLLLEHVGRTSGIVRTTPLLYTRDGSDLIIVGSRGGSDAMPAWWLNLRDAPETTVQVGRSHVPVTARLATAEERARLWPMVVATYADYEVYQQRTTREIPVIILTPRT